MTADHDLSIARHFADLPDPRIDRTRKHALLDILVIALCATIAGADSWEEAERFGEAKLAWLRRSLALPNGVPSHDTFNRVFARLDPRAFGRCVSNWMAAACEATGLRHVPIDGKSARSAPRGTSCGCLHLVNAWAAESRLVLGQEAVADGSHEIAAIPELLRVLDLKGAPVTIDAAGCQTAIVRQIRAGGGHDLLAVKGNQPTLHEAVTGVFDRACEADFAGFEHDGYEEVEDGHRRHEERYVTVVYDPEGLPPEWPDVAAVIPVGREREVKGKRTDTAHYDVTSLRGTAVELGRLVRRHWSVEIPQPEDPRSDNLCGVGAAGYHRRRRPVGVGRVERQKPPGPRRHFMFNGESTCAPPALGFSAEPTDRDLGPTPARSSAEAPTSPRRAPRSSPGHRRGCAGGGKS